MPCRSQNISCKKVPFINKGRSENSRLPYPERTGVTSLPQTVLLFQIKQEIVVGKPLDVDFPDFTIQQ